MSRIDFDPEEMQFRNEIQAALAGARQAADRCPTPHLLMAARSGVPFDGSAAVASHAALCPVCAQLVQDLAEYEFPGASPAEDRRIRARWRPRWQAPTWRLLAVAAAAAVVLLVVLVPRNTRLDIQPLKSPAKQAAPPAAPPSPAPFTLAKAAIKLPAFAALTFRGDAGGAKAYLADLAAALEPYRRDDYAEAVRRLSALAPKYPSAAEPAYYEGVSQLFLNQNEAAIASLQAARRRADHTLADDISWYRALAFHRAGRTSSALHEAQALCRRAGEYQERACAVAHALSAKGRASRAAL